MGKKKVAQVWSLSTKFRDKRKNKKYPGITKVIIEKGENGDDKLRLDVYGPLGFVHVGTLVMSDGRLFVKTMSGETYEGDATPEGVAKVLKIPIEPRDLLSLFTQEGFLDKTWICSQGESGHLKECEHRPYETTVQWSGSMTQSGTRLELDHPKAYVKFKVKSYTEKRGLDSSLFSF